MVDMNRYLEKYIREDLDQKIILLTGPRQVGKTTLSKMFYESFDYFSYDNPEHRPALLERSWDRGKDLIIFDELHKLKKWKSWDSGSIDRSQAMPQDRGVLETDVWKLPLPLWPVPRHSTCQISGTGFIDLRLRLLYSIYRAIWFRLIHE